MVAKSRPATPRRRPMQRSGTPQKRPPRRRPTSGRHTLARSRTGPTKSRISSGESGALPGITTMSAVRDRGVLEVLPAAAALPPSSRARSNCSATNARGPGSATRPSSGSCISSATSTSRCTPHRVTAAGTGCRCPSSEARQPPYGSLNLHAIWDSTWCAGWSWTAAASVRSFRCRSPAATGTLGEGSIPLDRRESPDRERHRLSAPSGGRFLLEQDRGRGRDREEYYSKAAP